MIALPALISSLAAASSMSVSFRASSGKIADPTSQSEHTGSRRRGSGHAGLHLSPSLPALANMTAPPGTGASTEERDTIAIDIPPSSTHDDGSLGSLTMEGEDGALEV